MGGDRVLVVGNKSGTPGIDHDPLGHIERNLIPPLAMELGVEASHRAI
jgi:hypothetical protein